MSADFATYQGVCYPWQLDHMGHMNVMWYVSKFDEATWALFDHLGMSAQWLRDRGRSMAAVEQNLQYRREVFPGDTLRVTSQIREYGPRKITYRHTMHGADGEVVAVCTMTGVHIDSKSRKAVAMPDEILERLQNLADGSPEPKHSTKA